MTLQFLRGRLSKKEKLCFSLWLCKSFVCIIGEKGLEYFDYQLFCTAESIESLIGKEIIHISDICNYVNIKKKKKIKKSEITEMQMFW